MNVEEKVDEKPVKNAFLRDSLRDSLREKELPLAESELQKPAAKTRITRDDDEKFSSQIDPNSPPPKILYKKLTAIKPETPI